MFGLTFEMSLLTCWLDFAPYLFLERPIWGIKKEIKKTMICSNTILCCRCLQKGLKKSRLYCKIFLGTCKTPWIISSCLFYNSEKKGTWIVSEACVMLYVRLWERVILYGKVFMEWHILFAKWSHMEMFFIHMSNAVGVRRSADTVHRISQFGDQTALHTVLIRSR